MPTFDVEITDLRGFVLATTRDDRVGAGPGGDDPLVFSNYADVALPTPLSDTKEAQASFSVEDEVAELLYFEGITDDGGNTYQIGALGRMLRVYVRESLQPKFWGQILIARWSPQRVLVTAQDQSIRLKKHFTRYGDDVVGDPPPPAPHVNSPLDYSTIVNLIEAAQNVPGPGGQENYPPLGIDTTSGVFDGISAPWVIFTEASSGNFTLTFDGQTTGNIAYNASAATVMTALEALSTIGVGEALVEKPQSGMWTVTFAGTLDGTTLALTGAVGTLNADIAVNRSTIEIKRGDNVWDRIIEVSEARYGPDFELDPRDDLGVAQTDSLGGTWPFYAVLNTYDKQGVDRTATTIFTYIEGAPDNNLEGIEWEPSGDPVRNAVTTVQQGTEDDPGVRVFAHDLDSWTDIGIYVDWQAPGGGNSEFSRDALRDVANDEVRAYSRPPNFFTLHPRAETVDPGDTLVPRVYDSYYVGDEITVQVQKGYFVFEGTARITKITPRQIDQAGNLKCEIECVPSVTSQESVTVGDDD